MAKMPKIYVESPLGVLNYTIVTGQGKENFEGTGYDYQSCVDVPNKEAEKFIDLIEDFIDDNEIKGAKRSGIIYRTNDDDDQIPKGVTRFCFKTSTEFEDRKTGDMIPTEIQILNAAGQRTKLPNGIGIGNGSKGKVYGILGLWERGSNKNKEFGASLFLTKVQIADFVPYEGVKIEPIEGSFSGFENMPQVVEDEEDIPRSRRSRHSRNNDEDEEETSRPRRLSGDEDEIPRRRSRG